MCSLTSSLASALTLWTFGTSYFASVSFSLSGKVHVTNLRIKYINVQEVHRLVPGM